MKDILLDKYILKTITEKELTDLKSYFKSDLDFQNETKLRMDIYKSVEAIGDAELKGMLDKIHDKVVVREQPPSVQPIAKQSKAKLRLLIGGVLSIAAIITCFILMWPGIKNSQSTDLTPMAMFENNYEPYDNFLASRSDDDDKYLITFNDYYKAKDYKNALSVIKDRVNESDDEVKLMAAIAAIESDELEFGNRILTGIIDSKSEYYIHHALWYRALIQMRLDNLEQSIIDLKQIGLDTQADHYSEAEQLLKKIELKVSQ